MAGPVSALVITPNFDSSITSDLNAAAIEATINQALQYYQTNITTPITVGITFSEMDSGLGQSSTYVTSVTYTQYRNALISHASSANDASALLSVPVGPNNPVNGTASVDSSLPLLRALGFNAAAPGGNDSTISLNMSLMNINRSLIDPGKYDLMSVVQHETDEVLGLGSDLDSGVTNADIRPEDLFRYASAGTRSFTTSSSATSYFSINGGVTNLVGFNQVGPPGDSDYGDWSSSATPHVQDAFGTPGATPNIGVEATALDVVGYTFIPEPTCLSVIALGAIGALHRRRRNAVGGTFEEPIKRSCHNQG